MKTLGTFAVGFTVAIILCWALFSNGNGPKIVNTTDSTTTIELDTSEAIVDDAPELASEELASEVKWLWRYVDTAAIKATVKIDSAKIMALVKVDSLGIVRDYFIKRTYARDTTVNEVHLIDSIGTYMNRLEFFKSSVVNMKATEKNTVINHNTDIIYTRELFLKGDLSTKSIEGSVLFQNNAWIFELGYQHVFPLDDSFVKAGVGYRIKKW